MSHRIHPGYLADKEIKLTDWTLSAFVLGVPEGRVDAVVNNYPEVSAVTM